jgi:hypothetical protein
VLQDASGLEPRALRDALRDAIAHHVLITQPGGHLAFRHALLREVVHDDLLPGERSGLHRRLATVLEARAAAEPCVGLEHATEIAHHFDAAGDQPAALRTAVRAAQTAERAQLLAAKAGGLMLWGRHADARAMAQEALDVADAVRARILEPRRGAPPDR